ncbi:MAG: hypothetical protein NPIRA02_13250 [Nitrospirales bacterium]|nr:MAG: hypothetical protein NPIRA02_13250 [Nitrospirales bacterium]
MPIVILLFSVTPDHDHIRYELDIPTAKVLGGTLGSNPERLGLYLPNAREASSLLGLFNLRQASV